MKSRVKHFAHDAVQYTWMNESLNEINVNIQLLNIELNIFKLKTMFNIDICSEVE